MNDLLADALPPVSLKDQISCVGREIAMRKRVYPHWIRNGRMKEGAAREEIRRMEAVLATLQNIQGHEKGK